MKKDTIEDCQKWALNKQGKCLETVYVNNRTKMLWECEKGHQWKTRWDKIKLGGWCPYCVGRYNNNLILCQKFASNKGGKCLETVYINAQTKMNWECSEGHQWKTTFNSLRTNNTWCSYCAGLNKPNIKELQEYAKSKKGNLISTSYINCKLNMLWKCERGHQWKASWDGIKRGNWCPECASFKTEYKCKDLLEQKLGIRLTKTTFKYNNHKYQWDGYNEENKVAFEYQGYQHYIYPNRWQKTLEEHKKAKQRDLDKVKYAKENGIKLIIIPYTEEKNLENYINNIIGN